MKKSNDGLSIAKADDVQFNWYVPSESVKKALIRLEEGEELKERQRRLCVKFLISMDMYTPEELSAIFRVDTEVIIQDIATITEERNAVIGSVNPVDFLAEYIENQMYALRKMRWAIESDEVVGRERIAALDKYSIANMRLLESLQSLGALPKELGNISVTKEEWVASIDDSGTPRFEQKLEAGTKRGLLGIDDSEVITLEVDEEDAIGVS